MINKDKIKQILTQSFNTSHIEIVDQSDQHRGHSEAKTHGGGHYFALIVSDDFKNKTSLQRQRMVYDCLREALAGDIHALSLKTVTNQEHSVQ